MATRPERKKPRPPAKATLMRRSTDIEDVRFPTRAVVGLVLFTAALVGGQWAITSGLRGDIAAIITRMDAQKEIDARDKAASGREAAAEKSILDGRLQNIEKRVDEIDRAYKLGDYDIKSLLERMKR